MANSLPDATGYSGEREGLFIPRDMDPAIAVRQCWEMAEMLHLGPWEAYVDDLRAYLETCERIVEKRKSHQC